MESAISERFSAGLRHLRYFLLVFVVAMSGCGGGDGGDDDSGGSSDSGNASPTALDLDIEQMARMMSLTGDPASVRGLEQTPPDEDDRVKLGQLLFFSQTLSGGFDGSCGTCHHPDFAGSDGLSIGVGIIPEHRNVVGPGRIVDPAKNDLDPQADGGPNMHRNSMTTFNSALFDRALMFDGRVFVLDEETEYGGHGQNIRSPESGQTADITAVDGLMEHTMKGPIVNDNEMRGFLYTDLTTPVTYREHLVARLRGEVDTQFMEPGAADNWLALFQDAFNDPSGTAQELITMLNVQRALAAYIKASIFVDTPWQAYLDGDMDAISEDAKKGAMLFLESPENDGLGCASCHSGDKFSEENFYNVGFPQIGRGFARADRKDMGRWTQTRLDEDLFAFRVPTLLNVAETAPYGHAGTFATLEEAINYHVDPRSGVLSYGFDLQHLGQYQDSGIFYDYAEAHTNEAINSDSFAATEHLLPGQALSQTEVDQLIAFLQSLTDPCVTTPSCVGRWAPAASEDPDGHLLVRGDGSSAPGDVDAQDPTDYPDEIALNFPGLTARTTFADVEACTDNLDAGGNTGQPRFISHTGDPDFGLTHPHGFSQETWFDVERSQLEAVMIAGGVSASYLNDDCYPDLVFAGGDASGMKFYENLDGASFQELTNFLTDDPGTRFTGSAFADLDGDYRREMLLGNLHGGSVPVYSPNGAAQWKRVADIGTTRHTFGIAFAPLDDSGYPYIYLAHWAGGSGTTGTAPGLLRNDGGLALQPWDTQAQTTSAFIDPQFNFTPKFADFTGDGFVDLVIASDFGTSETLQHDGATNFAFDNQTDEAVITDENGMGSTLLDIDNDGNLEWFVTSILDPDAAEGNWGVTGNRLYRNVTDKESASPELRFEDITEQAGVRDGYWGWGACAADFDNDGYIDIFHVNGFGYIPSEVDKEDIKENYRDLAAYFQNKPPLLFMNDGDGTFTEEAADWNIDEPSEGRGVVCFDYDRDGDMDIVLLDHSTGLQFFENDIGHDEGHRFLSIRLVGQSPNTDAIGARVHVTANIDGNGNQTMLRLSEANSNFNSQNPPDLHFGLGEAATADIRVLWPGGTVTIVDRTRVVSPAGAELVCEDVAVNQFLVLDQRDGQAACPAPLQ